MKKLSSVKICYLEDTKDFSIELANIIKPGMALGLNGDLGAGKTTLTRLLVKELGSNDEVTSPSYVLQHEYKFKGGLIEHWDLYRLKSCPEELLEPVGSANIRIIEWSDKFSELQETIDLILQIEIIAENEREFRLFQAFHSE